ncbi:MAG: exonuclease domain-containing protein [Candidatus Gracilibacteria bacterium]
MFIALDTETTGLDPKNDRLIEIAALKIDENGTVLDTFHTLINPGIALSEFIKNLTGIQDEDLRTAPAIESVKNDLIAFIGDAPILGHSVQFDIDFFVANGIPVSGAVFDTLHLSQTLLPHEASYSLEILSEKYKLLHESKHRALDDVKATIALFQFLKEKITKIPETMIPQMQAILEKSGWAWREIFKENFGKNPSNETHTDSAQKTIPPDDQKRLTPTHLALKDLLREKLEQNQSAIIEAPFYNPIDLVIAAAEAVESTGEKVLIATDALNQIDPDARVSHLHAPGKYLCTTALKTLLEKPQFTDAETRTLLKIILWQDQIHEGAKHEITLCDDEENVWLELSAYSHLLPNPCTDPDCFYARALEKAHRAPVLLISPDLLLENVIEQERLIPQRNALIFDKIENFELATLDLFTRYFHSEKFLRLADKTQNEALKNRLMILFGLIGILFEKYAAHNDYTPKLILSNELTGAKEWQDLESNLQNLEELLSEPHQTPSVPLILLRLNFEKLKKALSLKPTMLTWIQLKEDGSPMIRSCPTQITELVQQKIWSRYKTQLFVSGFATIQGSFSLMKTNNALSPDLEEIQLPPASSGKLTFPQLHLYPELPTPNSPKNLSASLSTIKNIFLGKIGEPGAIFILANSNQATEQFHDGMAGFCKSQGRILLGQNVTGGIGKIIQRFEHEAEKCVLIGTERLFQAALKSEKSTAIKTFLLLRLPFYPASHPLHEKMAAQLQNSFMGYSLPRAMILFKKHLYRLLEHTSVEDIHILDPRFEHYDRKFLMALPKGVKL